MSYNGSGTFVINSAGQPVVSGTVISSTAFNALTADLATGLSTAITKDGQTTVTANIPMANYKFTGLGTGSAAGDSANLSQVQSTAVKLLASVSGADTITAVGSPNVAAYVAGQMFYFVAAAANTGAVTINIDSLGAKSITRDGTTALAAGDIQSGEVCVIVYDGTQFQLVNGASQSASIVTENLTVNKATVLNESGGDNDTRIEGDTDPNLLFVDASTDRVGVGTDTPLANFQVGNGTATTEIRIDADGGSGAGGFIRGYKDTSNASWYFGDLNPIAGGTNDGLCAYAYGANPFTVFTNGLERLRVDSAGNLGLGVTPSAWNSLFKALDFSTTASLAGAAGSASLFNNAYWDGSQYVYKTNAEATRYLQASGEHIWYTAGSGTAGGGISFTQALSVGLGTSLALQGATSQTGTGITFPATQNASSNANTLDDYEEGTFTPTLSGQTTAGTTTYITQTGYYTKIGRQVNITLSVAYSALTGTGNLRIEGLPFTILNAADYYPVGACLPSNLNWTSGTSLVALGLVNSAIIYLYGASDNGGASAQQCVDESADFRITMTYFV